MPQELRINTPGIGALRCQLGTFKARITPDKDGTLPQKARRVVKAWSSNLFSGASFAIDYSDGTAHLCQSWGEIGLLFDLKPPAKGKKPPPRTLEQHIDRVRRMADVVAIVDAREPAARPAELLEAFGTAPSVAAAVKPCDKASAKSPCSDGEILERKCGCGKVYRRCGTHGGFDGTTRSLRSHWTLSGHDWQTGRSIPPPIGGPAYLDAFGVAALPPAAVAAPLAEPSAPAPKAVPAWVAMMRFRAAPRVVARMPKAVAS